MKKLMKKIKNYLPSIILVLLVICTVSADVVYAKYIRRETATKIDLTVDAYGHMDIALCNNANVETLWEEYTFNIVPGTTIGYNPYLYLAANSEDGYLFIKIDENISNGLTFTDYVQYGVRDDVWTALDGVSGVYWIYVETSINDRYFGIIHDNAATPVNDQVIIPDTVTEAKMAALGGASPTLTITAYSCHSANLGAKPTTDEEKADMAKDAWAAVQNEYLTP